MTSPKQSAYKSIEGIQVSVVSMGLHMKEMSPVISFRERASAPARIYGVKNKQILACSEINNTPSFLRRLHTQ